MEKITWHQNSRFKLREENKSPSAYSRVVLENLIRCTAAEKGYLTAEPTLTSQPQQTTTTDTVTLTIYLMIRKAQL